MKNRKRLLIPLSLFIIAAFSGSVLAYMFKQTDYKENTIIPARLTCEVKEITNADISKKTQITVKNTGNISAYIRVRLVSYWVDEKGIVPKESHQPNFIVSKDWIKGSDDTYYYKHPVSPGDETLNILDESSIIELAEDNDGNKQVIEIFAEAIQSKPLKSVINSWNVILDDSYSISSIL